MDIQPILNKVLDAGLYGGREFMCHALEDAHGTGLITVAEYGEARAQIHQYISSINPGTACLANCFDAKGRFLRNNRDGVSVRLEDFVSGQGLAIFKDWANRPMP